MTTALPSSTAKNFIPTGSRPDVTDHAVLRYLERALGYDIEGTRRLIESLVGPAVALGATSLSVDGVTFKFDHNRVVTALPIQSPKYRRQAGDAPVIDPALARDDKMANRRKRSHGWRRSK